VNYAPYNWGYDLNDLKISEIAKSGANAVRLVWYAHSELPIYSNYAALDSVLSQCTQHQLIAILELHDFTCENDYNALLKATDWWTSPEILSILDKYRHSVIINFANEALQVSWQENPDLALLAFKNTYSSILSKLRASSNFDFPILIDAPDCGQSSAIFSTSNTAIDLINADPKHNLIFSVHTYWYMYANNDSTQIATKTNNLLKAQIPFILGEIANQQDVDTMCQYNLNYKALLNYCEQNKISWLSWVWENDLCPQRAMTTDGNFANLTEYGFDLINHKNYGLLTHSATKSKYLVNGFCETDLVSNEVIPSFYLTAHKGRFKIQKLPTSYTLKCTDLTGKEVKITQLKKNKFKINAASGTYKLFIQDWINLSTTYVQILNK
jgi:mannan endo-1,4-beta-mannosidase